jgi:hypothetical protein
MRLRRASNFREMAFTINVNRKTSTARPSRL